MKNRVTKLNKSEVKLSNGTIFTIVHNFKKMKGSVDSFDAAFQNWLMRTNDYTADSFVNYVQSKSEEGRIFVTLEDYEAITNGKAIHATKEEFDAENN